MDGKTLAGSEDQGAGPSAGVFALQLMYEDRLGTFAADRRWALFWRKAGMAGSWRNTRSFRILRIAITVPGKIQRKSSG
jgi:hypothetical protein